MRFPHLPIGQRFSFKGKTYTKTGPLTASEEATGNNQLIMKSAEVTPLELVEKPVNRQEKPFSESEVREMFTHYREELRSTLLEMADRQGGLVLDEVLDLIDELSLPMGGD